MPPTIRLMSRMASGPPTWITRDQWTFSSMPIASAIDSRSVVKPGADVRSTGAMRKPPSESFCEPGSACVATESVQPFVGSVNR